MLERLLALLAKLRPRQKMSDIGSGNMQIGSAKGAVVGSVTHHHTQHHHSHITIIQTHSSESKETKATEERPSPTSAEQSSVLRRLNQLRDRVAVLDFMEREFGTRMVIHLNSEQLYRLNRYLDVVLRDPRKAKNTYRKNQAALEQQNEIN